MTIDGDKIIYEDQMGEWVRRIIYEADAIRRYGSLERQREVLDYISRTELNPKSLPSCHYVLYMNKEEIK